MRISTDPDDSHYSIFAGHAQVSLNSQPVRDVITADEEACCIWKAWRDERGHIVPDPEDPERIRICKARGKIQVTLPDWLAELWKVS